MPNGNRERVPPPSSKEQGGSTAPTEAPTIVGGGPLYAGHDATWPVLPDFEIVEEVGRGGMGIVYKARQLSRNRIVALKVIRKDRLPSDEAVRRFRREAEAASRLSHPNVVLVYDSDHSGDTHYLAMEFVKGVTLENLVEQKGPLSVDQACKYVRQAALGLQHAHEQALVHRDIKPGNLMVTWPTQNANAAAAPDGVVKILDMGVARLYTLGESPIDSLSTLTQGGAVIGTADYIAPEQLENPHAADIRADLYSLGCTFYYLLTGQVPFPGGTLIQKLDRQRWETPPAVNQHKPHLPQAVVDVVHRLMAKKPADRLQTPADLVTALTQLQQNGFVRPTSAPAVEPTHRLVGHTDSVFAMAMSPDSRVLVSGGKDRVLLFWDTTNGTLLRTATPLPQDIRAVTFSLDGTHIAMASGVSVRVWKADSMQESWRFVGHTDVVRDVAFTPNGQRLLSAAEDRSVRVWDLRMRREVFRLGHRGGVASLAVTPDGKKAVTAARDHTLRVWDLLTGKEVRRFNAPRGQIMSVAVSPDGLHVASAHFDTLVRLWDLETGRELRRLHGHKQMVTSAIFSRDGSRVLSGSQDRTVRLWDIDSGLEICCFAGHTRGVTDVAVDRAGNHAVSASTDHTLCVWQL